MTRYALLWVWAVGMVSVASMNTSCGPSCADTLRTYSEFDLYNSDVSRVNRLVTLRKMAMDDAENETSSPLRLERIKFSVTAIELAIEIQVQAMILSSEHAEDETVAKMGGRFTEIRCLVEEYAAQEEYDVSDSRGKTLLDTKQELKSAFGKTGLPSRRNLERIFAKGLDPKKGEGDKEEKAAEDDETSTTDEAESDETSSEEEDDDEDEDSGETDSEDSESTDDFDF